ncbi:MAG: tRNA-intron lyase [Desulfurococcales archaeon]|jgi:tRNA-intron endonuclease|nr:tRNA-intron lyase [Fervidicoccaceae archaeon]NAZ11547.1 tRNA-intron lyase [Desulfurococcales archaeon]
MTSSTSSSTGNEKPRGVLIGIRVIVPNPDEASELYIKGVYGKPFGIKKPGLQKYNDVLELSLFEALYLLENDSITIENADGKKLSVEELRKISLERIPDFQELYDVYRDFRKKGFIVRSGMKFGSDFSLYKTAPGIEHAPYLVGVFKKDSEIDPVELIRAGRLSHSVRKKFIIAVHLGDNVKYAFLEWYKP